MSVNRVAAAAGSRQQGNGKKRKRIEKTTYVETKNVITPDGGEVEVRLIAKGGWIGLGELIETGEPVFAPLECVRDRGAPHDVDRLARDGTNAAHVVRIVRDAVMWPRIDRTTAHRRFRAGRARTNAWWVVVTTISM